MSRWLIACECSGVVRRALRARGYDAWSCDWQPAEDGDPHHFQGNVVDHEIIKRGWDGLIAFPDCTFLTVSGNRWNSEPWRVEARQWGIAFVRTLWALPIRYKALENPIGRLSTLWQPWTQIIHPHQFGHGERKPTCLWLDSLPPLVPTNIVEGRVGRVHHMPPSPNRRRDRSRTYDGIGDAMAEQWGRYVEMQIAA